MSPNPLVKLKWSWYFDDKLIPGATSPEYSPPYEKLIELGKKYYYAKVTGTYKGKEIGTIKSRVALLDVKVYIA